MSKKIIIPKDSHITYIDDANKYQEATLEFIIHENAHFEYILSIMDQQNSITSRTITTQLVGEHASAKITTHFYGKKEDKVTFNTIQHHHAPKTSSNVCVKGALDDKSQLFTQSTIRVEKTADKAIAEQVNKNLLLSDTAHAISIPILEVLANDVSCRHGAAMSQLDKNQLFYLQSKGLDFLQARTILIEAFLTK